MSVTVLFIFLTLSFIFLFGRRKKVALTFFFFGAFWLFFVGCGILANIIAHHLTHYSPLVDPQWKSQNAIIILGAQTVQAPESKSVKPPLIGYSRLFEGASLYFDCKKINRQCFIITSGGDPSRHGTTEAKVLAQALKEIGVSAKDIILEEQSRTTFENAQFVKEILTSQKVDSTILVTSGLHLPRALMYFNFFGLKPQPAPSDEINIELTRLPNSLNFALTDYAFVEWITARYFLFYNTRGTFLRSKR